MGIIYGREEKIYVLEGIGCVGLPLSLSGYERQEKSRETRDAGLFAWVINTEQTTWGRDHVWAK